ATRCYRDWSSDVCSSDLKEKAPQCLAMVDLVYLRLPIFSSKAVLVLDHNVGERVRHVAGDVVAACRRCQTGLVETTDNEMRRSRSEERRVGKECGYWGAV